MADQRIILANDSRLLREMLNRILLKAENLKVVQQVSSHESLPDSIQQKDAEWIILSTQEDNKIPDWSDAYMQDHPFVKILTLSPDGSWIKLKWLDKREQEFTDPSLQLLIRILENVSNTKKIVV